MDQKTERDLSILFESFNSSYLLLSTSSDKNSNDKLTKDLNSNFTHKSRLTIQFDDAKKELILSKTGKFMLNLFYYYRKKAFKYKYLLI